MVGLARSLAQAVTELNGFSGLAPVVSCHSSCVRVRYLPSRGNPGAGGIVCPEWSGPSPGTVQNSARPDLGAAVWYGPRSRPRSGVDVDLHEYVPGYPANPRRFNVFVTAGLNGLPQPVVDRLRTELDAMADARQIRFTVFGRVKWRGVRSPRWRRSIAMPKCSGRRSGGGRSRWLGGSGARARWEVSEPVGLVPGRPAGDGMWYVHSRNGEATEVVVRDDGVSRLPSWLVAGREGLSLWDSLVG